MDMYMAFHSSVERDNWYHMIIEVQVGWKLAQGTCISQLDTNMYILWCT